MRALAEIDKNFKVEKLGSAEYAFRDCREEPFRIYGLLMPTEETPHFMRMPQAVADQVNVQVQELACNTTGGRIRFKTDSAKVAVRVWMHDVLKAPHFPLTGSAGLDLYADGIYRGTYVPPYDMTDYFEGRVDMKSPGMREILIHMPLYAGVIKLEIGVEPGSQLLPAEEYKHKVPVLYYGSSITQGACASRPGNSYQNIISRELSCDQVNLGFSSGALAEEVMIDYLTKQKMSVFVMDYDHNAPNPAHLAATHEKLYRAMRKAQPELPIIMITMPKIVLNDDILQRKAVVLATYEKAVAEGDTKVRYIDGCEMIQCMGTDGGLVDNAHPNDLGFLCMAKVIGAAVKEFLVEA